MLFLVEKKANLDGVFVGVFQLLCKKSIFVCKYLIENIEMLCFENIKIGNGWWVKRSGWRRASGDKSNPIVGG